jgi:hypothetical protein
LGKGIKTFPHFKNKLLYVTNKQIIMANKTKVSPYRAILHGECGIIQSSIPAGAKPITVEDNCLIIADSETTGNHHVLDVAPGIEVLQKETKRFIRNSVPASVRCVHADRHDTLTIPPGEWELTIAQEFDYFKMSKSNVRD